MKKVALSAVKDGLSRYLRVAEREELVITRHGRPAGVLIGFASEDEWFEYRLVNDPRFQKRIASARQQIRDGQGIRIEQLPVESARRGRVRAISPARRRR